MIVAIDFKAEHFQASSQQEIKEKMSAETLCQWFPWIQRPIVVSAPMFTAASANLATEVTKAGGIGV